MSLALAGIRARFDVEHWRPKGLTESHRCVQNGSFDTTGIPKRPGGGSRPVMRHQGTRERIAVVEGGERLTLTTNLAHNDGTQTDGRVIGELALGNLDTNVHTRTTWLDGSPGRSVGADRPVRVAIPIPLCSNWREHELGTDVEVASPSGGRTLALSNHRGGKQCR